MYIADTFCALLGNPNIYHGNFTGQIYWWRYPDGLAASAKRIYLPPAISATGRRPAGENYGNRQYQTGGHTANLVIDEMFRCYRQSISAPNTPPGLSAGAGTTLQIGYQRFYDEVTGERSPLSEGTQITGDLNRAWSALSTEVPNEKVVVEGTADIAAGVVTGLKTNFGDLRPGDRIAKFNDLTRWGLILTINSQLSMTVDDTALAAAASPLVAKTVSRVSHIELWISVDGALPRFITRLRIGTTTFSESTATLALGEAETVSFSAMPRGEFSVVYNDRQVIAGVDGHRDTLYLSAIAFPERHEGLAFRTTYNEPIVGLLKYRNYVIAICPDSCYKLQGYTEDDYVFTVLEPKIGGAGHHGNAVTETFAVIPGRKRIQVFNGAFHQGMPGRWTEWSEEYKANKVAYEEGFGTVNQDDGTYQFHPLTEWFSIITNGTTGEQQPLLPAAPTRTRVWIGDYNSVVAQPSGDILPLNWTSDSPNTPDHVQAFVTAAAYLAAPGEKIGQFYRGNSKGKIFIEDADTAYTGTARLCPSHLLFDDPGGQRREGKKLTTLWSYLDTDVTNEGTKVGEVHVWAGDEYARGPAITSNGLANAAAAAYVGNLYGTHKTQGGPGGSTQTIQPEVVRTHQPGVQGRGFSIEYVFTNPKRIRFIGLGGVWGVGDTSRGVRTQTGGA